MEQGFYFKCLNRNILLKHYCITVNESRLKIYLYIENEMQQNVNTEKTGTLCNI